MRLPGCGAGIDLFFARTPKDTVGPAVTVMVGHVPCLQFYCQRSVTGSLIHDAGLSRMAVELALRGYMRTQADDGHRNFRLLGWEYDRDVAYIQHGVVVGAATDFEATRSCC